MKRNGCGNGHGADGQGGNGEGVGAGEPRGRARYITSSTPAANDGGGLVLVQIDQLLELVRLAVSEVVTEASRRPPASTLLDRVGIAKALSCSPGQVDKLRRGGMPCLYVGDSPRFEHAVCVEWLRREENS